MTPTRINLLDPEVRRDPFPIYRALRERAPAEQIEPGGIWALGRYADVSNALHDPCTYSSRGFRAALAPDWLGDDRLGNMLIAVDPPEHTALRAVIQHLFGRDLLGRLELPLRAFLDSLLVELEDGHETDVVAKIAGPIAACTMCMVLGLDLEQHGRFKTWIDAVGMITPIAPDPSTAARIRAAIEEEHRYFHALVAARRARPDGDLVSQLVHARFQERTLSDDEIVCFLCLLLGAGVDTTVHLLSKSLLLLSSRSDLHRQLSATPAAIPEFIEEMLRFDPPTHGLLRVTTRDVELDGVPIPQHSLVLLLLASANRDPQRYDDPDVFRVGRSTRGSLSFGHGPHNCIGAALARFETRLALEHLVPRFGAFERDASELIQWDSALHTRGPVALPMRLRQAN